MARQKGTGVAVEPMLPVVVGLVGCPTSLHALDLAAEEALGRVTPLDIVYVHQSSADGVEGPACALYRARDLLDAAVVRVRSEYPGLAVRGCFETGDAAEALLRHAESACLVVLGHGGTGTAFGPVAQRVVGASVAPVLVCRSFDREHTDPRPRPILVGVPEPSRCDEVLGFAFEEAAVRGAPVLARHVRMAQEQHPIDEALAGWSAKYPEVEVVPEVVDGTGADVPAALLDASHDAQLVIVGRDCRPGSGGPLLGTVSRALLAHAGCSVAVVTRP
jgi:nucleotide-binding universal stress UspA family protein